MMKTHIGIDPGKNGGIAIISETNTIVYKIPLIGKVIDLQELNKIFKSVKGENPHAVLEDVHSIHGVPATTNFVLGECRGNLLMALVIYDIPFTLVQPKAWQKEMFQGVPEMYKTTSKKKDDEVIKKNKVDTKAMALVACKRIFPEVDLRATEKSKVAHDGIVDALLMAEYCRRHFK